MTSGWWLPVSSSLDSCWVYLPAGLFWGWLVYRVVLWLVHVFWLPHVNENVNPERFGLPKKDLLTKIKLYREYGELPPMYPNGWFHVCESAELAEGGVKRLDVCGLHLVAFRGEDGVVYVTDAYCPHMGANLGTGGTVVGNCIECPFHGWQFSGKDGSCTHVPYEQRPPSGATLNTYTCEELNGSVFLWYDCDGREPTWRVDPIDEIENGDWRQVGYTTHVFNSHVQEIAENSADEVHFQILHFPLVYSDLPELPDFVRWFGRHLVYHDFSVKWSRSEEQSHVSLMDMSHTFRFFPGTLDLSVFTKLDAAVTGPGIIVFRHLGPWGAKGCFVYTFTPIGPMRVKFTRTFWLSKRLPLWIGKFFMTCELTQMERDVMIWHNKKYLSAPALVKNDGPIRHFRKWYSQFYSENSPKFSMKQKDGLDW